jgi:hypothetical protein
VTRRRRAGPGAPVDGLETHYLHQPPDTFAVDPVSLVLQPCGQAACPVERRGQVLTINHLHESQVLLRDFNGLVVKAGVADAQQLALTHH